MYAGKVGGLIVTLGAVLYAVFGVEKVLNTFLMTETLATFVGVSVLAGIVWPRANRWGAIGSIAIAMTVNFVAHIAMGYRFDHWDPNIFLISLVSGIGAMILISLCTPAETGERTKDFFLKLNTPSDDPAIGATLGVTPEKQRELAEQGRLLILVNLLSLRKAAGGVGLFQAYRNDLKGLLFGFGLVIALVGTLAFIVR
jgi:Na+/proline symporter